MARWTLLLLTHVVLLILASTFFTVVTRVSGVPLRWEYFTYKSQSGWGVPYQFPYSLLVVITYLAAYATGFATYLIAWQWGSRVIAATGIFFCMLGLASFGYESIHWLSDIYASWIVSLPVPLLLLAIAVGVQ